MPFAYYNRLSKKDRAIYRRSDRIVEVALPGSKRYREFAEAVVHALESGNRGAVKDAGSGLVTAINGALGIPPVSVRVLNARPRSARSEMHGLYVREPGKVPVITLWMRTAAHKAIVAPRTFLRTLLHEACHHLDFELIDLSETFHTEGFFKRESSLMRQIMPPPRAAAPPGKKNDPPIPSEKTERKEKRGSRRDGEGEKGKGRAKQLSLFD